MAIIFNHESFDTRTLKRRSGTNVDRDKLKYTLIDLGFEVTVYDNLIFKEIAKNIQQGQLWY